MRETNNTYELEGKPFLTDWFEVEHDVYKTSKRIMQIFAEWEAHNLKIVHGYRERNIESTYGFPYISSSEFAMISNCNVTAILKSDESYRFKWLGLTAEKEIVAGLHHKETSELKLITVGNLK